MCEKLRIQAGETDVRAVSTGKSMKRTVTVDVAAMLRLWKRSEGGIIGYSA